MPPQWPRVSTLLNQYVATERYAGIAAAISWSQSNPSFLHAGSLAFGSPEQVTSDSIFRLYSVTKVFTAVLTLILVEDGLLRLDQPISDFLPEFGRMTVAIDPSQSLAARPAIQQITITHLLTHTSGLSNWQPFLGDNPISVAYRAGGLTPGCIGIHKLRPGYGEQVRGLDDLVASLSRLPLIAEPGTEWNYSIGFDVLGALIERATGMRFAQVMETRILAPLDMRSTGFQVPLSDANRLTTLYGETDAGREVIDGGHTSDFLSPPTLVAGGGGLVSTARDLSRFAVALLEEGHLEGGRIAKAETIDKAIRLYSTKQDAVGAEPSVAAAAGQIVLSAVGASSTLLHVDRALGYAAVFLAQLNKSGPPAVATVYRPEILAAIEADICDQH